MVPSLRGVVKTAAVETRPSLQRDSVDALWWPGGDTQMATCAMFEIIPENPPIEFDPAVHCVRSKYICSMSLLDTVARNSELLSLSTQHT